VFRRAHVSKLRENLIMTRTIRLLSLSLASLSLGSLIAPAARADFLAGEVVKFQQLPLGLNTTVVPPIPGHDVTSTAYPVIGPGGTVIGYSGNYAADDFADKFTTPVVHVQWYGSYANNNTGTSGGTNQFLIAFESDVQAVPGAASHPGTVLSAQIVNKGALGPGSGTFTEVPVANVGGETIYKYNSELDLNQQFPEKPDTVYWLKIVALQTDPTVVWGWHNRDYTVQNPLASGPPIVNPGETNLGSAANPVWHFQDDAVTGGVSISTTSAAGIQVQQTGFTSQNYIDNIDGPVGISQFSEDLAFSLGTVPEPSQWALLGLGLGLILLVRRRHALS
jgi:hypothetical protein